MERPPHCPVDLYLIMRECWHADPTSRPTFARLVDEFDRILTSGGNGGSNSGGSHSDYYLDMNFPPPSDFSIGTGHGSSSGETLICGRNNGPLTSTCSSASSSTMTAGGCSGSGSFRGGRPLRGGQRCSSPIKYTQPSLSYSYSPQVFDSFDAPPGLEMPAVEAANLALMPSPPSAMVTYTPMMSSFSGYDPMRQQHNYVNDRRTEPGYVNQPSLSCSNSAYINNHGQQLEQQQPLDYPQLSLDQLRYEDDDEEASDCKASREVDEESAQVPLQVLSLDDYAERFPEQMESSAL